MDLFTHILVFSIAITAIECLTLSEVCGCVPLNICPRINRFSLEDEKYLSTVLKCQQEGFVRCCMNNEGSHLAARRSDDAENLILTDDVEKRRLNEELLPDIATTTEMLDVTTEIIATTTSEEYLTTQTPENNETIERKSKAVDNSISVIYPKDLESENNKNAIMEHLFLIFPNGEIETALASKRSSPENTSVKPLKRVVVRKRLIMKNSDAFEGAESKKSQIVIEPQQMDVEDVKKRLSVVQKKNRRRNESTSVSTSQTTEEPIIVEETTTKKKSRKKIRYRKRKQTTTPTTSTLLSITTKTLKDRLEDIETSSIKPHRKIIYNTRGRTNFLKRPTSQDDDESIEPEVVPTTTTSTAIVEPNELVINYDKVENVFTTPATPIVVKFANQIDIEHKAMIETVHKTLSAIHSGVDMKYVEKMINSHKTRMMEMRKHLPPPTVASESQSRPYRGSAKFRKPATTPAARESFHFQEPGVRTRNLSRTRNTGTTLSSLTTHKSVRKSPRTVTHAITHSKSLLEEIDRAPKLKVPMNFKASPLYGITMDKFNEFDNDMIEKIHETLQPISTIQNGFFPVITNGTPSSLL